MTAAGRLSTVTLPDGPLSYAYNPTTGKLTQVTAPDGGTLALTYAGSLLTNVAWSGTVSGQVGYSYDNDFRLSSVTVNGANPISFGYDADSLLTQAGALTLSHDAQNGLLTGSTLGNVTDTWSYNLFGEPASYSAASVAQRCSLSAYTRDKLGRITRKGGDRRRRCDHLRLRLRPRRAPRKSGRTVRWQRTIATTATATA